MTEIAYCPSQLVSNCNGNNNNNNGNGLDSRFSWIPCGLSPSMIEQYFKEHFVPSQIPYRDSEGAEFWDELFHYQYPKQDIGLSYCSFVNPEYRRLYQLLLEDRNRHALDIARTEIVTESDLTCSRCNGTITKSSVAVVAQMYLNSLSTELSTESPHSDSTTTTSSSISSSVASSPPAVPTSTISTTTTTTTNSHTTTPNKQPQHPQQQNQHHFSPNNLFEAFHPECFRCVTCEQPLAYYIYCVFHRQLYCERHYLEKLRPRCAACCEVSSILHSIHSRCRYSVVGCEHLGIRL